MPIRTCPNCRRENAADAAHCLACGATLSRAPLVIRNPAALSLSSEVLPPDHVKRVAATLAVSLAALLAEAGLRYLQRRLEQMPAPTIRRRREKVRETAVTPTIRIPKAAGQTRVITVMSERVVEERRWGRPVRRVVERFAWRSEERQGE